MKEERPKTICAVCDEKLVVGEPSFYYGVYLTECLPSQDYILVNPLEQMQKELRKAEGESGYLYGLIRGMQKDIEELKRK